MLKIEEVFTSSGSYPDRLKSKELTLDARLNAGKLVQAINELFADLKIPVPKINSGFRTQQANMAVKGSRLSAHCTCQAVDLHDTDQELYRLLATNIPLLKKHGLYMEDGSKTPSWCHLTTRAPASNKQIFLP